MSMQTIQLVSLIIPAAIIVASSPESEAAITVGFPGPSPGHANVLLRDHSAELRNNALSASWSWEGGRLVPSVLVNKLFGARIPPANEVFVLVMRDGKVLKASQLNVAQTKVVSVEADPKALTLAKRFPGKQVVAELVTKDGSLSVQWTASLRDGSNYIRQEIVLTPTRGSIDIAKLVMVDHELPAARVEGSVNGSPIVAGSFFTGFEHPMARADAVSTRPSPSSTPESLKADLMHCSMWLDLALPRGKGKPFTASSVFGVVPGGQLRRGFLYYVERERARAYQPFLHYNSWYDIGYFTPYNEKDCLGAIEGFAKELGGRGVKMDSFLFDDGWDDTSQGGQWRFHKGFPKGFTPVKEAAAMAGAQPGVWLSPWGGYGKPRIERRKSAEAAGFETVPDPEGSGNREYDRLLALSGPKYYESFHKACLEMVTRYGINQFKLDGTGSVNSVIPGSKFGSDFEAAIALIGDLRQAKPDLYINLTTGTWPSPFWLAICDSIWRGGDDHSFAGVGSFRQKWITYRDGDTYERIVRGGPLYPLNSLMLHGIIFAKHADHLDKDPGNDFSDEVRSYFGTGTQLQEMYVSHRLLTKDNWDVLAQCAKWSRVNAETLVDTHWIGGDPLKLEVYGHAAWSPRKGILVLRNPSDKEAKFSLEVGKLFELPAGAPRVYEVRCPFAQRETKLVGMLEAGKPVRLTLKPFEVLVFEALPK